MKYSKRDGIEGIIRNKRCRNCEDSSSDVKHGKETNKIMDRIVSLEEDVRSLKESNEAGLKVNADLQEIIIGLKQEISELKS